MSTMPGGAGATRRLAIVTPTFYPEQIGTPHYATDLARWFSEDGWQVSVITAQPFYPQYERLPGYGRSRRHDRLGKIEILRLPTIVPKRGAVAYRAVNELNFAAQGLARSIARTFDSVLSISAGTPWVTLVGSALRSARGVHVALVHDIQSGLATSLGLVRHLQGLLRMNEGWSLNHADHVVALTDEMLAALRDLGVAKPASVLPTWATVRPDGPTLGQHTERSVQYSGNFGEKQGVEVLMELASQLAEQDPSVTLVLRGSGHRFDAMRTRAARLGSSNLRFEAPVPQHGLAAALARSPVHLVTQAPGSAPYAMPSKIVNALVCGCHVIAMTDPDSAVARLATTIDGLDTVDVDDVSTLATRAIHLLDRPLSAGRRAAVASAASSRFDREVIADQFRELLSEARAERDRRTPEPVCWSPLVQASTGGAHAGN